MSPRFSIIVATLNRKDMLLRALNSIYAQTADAEIIVVDGGSADGTLEALATLPAIMLMRGPDRGLYDAFNKGLSRTGGDIVGILNSDDLYEPGAFAAVEQAFLLNPTADAICGTATLVDGSRTLEVYDDEDSKQLTPRAALIGNCMLNVRFFRRTALADFGAFDLQYRFVSDRDFLARFCEAKMTTVPLSERVYRYSKHPGSLTFSGDAQQSLAVHFDLLRLARNWRQAKTVSAEMRHTSLLLEGRCVAKLAQAEFRHGHFAAGLRHLLVDDDELSLGPARAITIGGADWLLQWLRNSAG